MPEENERTLICPFVSVAKLAAAAMQIKPKKLVLLTGNMQTKAVDEGIELVKQIFANSLEVDVFPLKKEDVLELQSPW